MKHPTLFLLLAAVSFCRGATFVVMNADSAGPGSLSDAISQAKALPAGTASTVEFDPAYFSIPRIIKPGPEGLLGYINRPVEINGPPLINGQPALLLSGDVNNDGHAGPGDGSLGTMELYPTPGFFALRRVAVAHCYSKDYFPGLYFGGAAGSSLLVEDCQFRNSQGAGAGGLNCTSAGTTVTVRRCRFSGNEALSAGSGGAAILDGLSAVTLEECVFSNNTAGGQGGAVVLNSTATVLRDCLFTGNTAASGGAVIMHASGALERCTFAGNAATGDAGGAINAMQFTSAATFVNCTFTGNRSARQGSAMMLDVVPASLIHCTITSNQADFPGTISAALPAVAASQSVSLTNCVIAGNGDSGSTGGTDVGAGTNVSSGGGNIIGIYTGVPAFTQPGDQYGTVSSPLAALLGPLQANGGLTPTCAPMKSSPAINTGTASAVTNDQRGLARPSGGAPDAGAVEFKVLNFAQWSALYPFDAGAAGQNDDPDGDGARNLVEYFTGTDPLSRSPSVLTAALSGGQMRMTYPMADHVATGAWRAAFQISQSLNSWSPSSQIPAATGPDGNSTRYEVFFKAGVPRRFARMVVEPVP